MPDPASPPSPTAAVRTSGWRPVDAIDVQGAPDLTDVLVRLLSLTGREDRLTQGFHTYPAGLHPDAARGLLELCGGDTLFDPFCGAGTTLVEAMALGRQAWGLDLSPVARLVARARTRLPGPEGITRLRSQGRRIAAQAQDWRHPPHDARTRAVLGWYEPHVAAELAGLRDGLLQAPEDTRELLWACFSSILVKVSLRASDTRAERVPQHREPGTTAVLFHKKVRELGRRLEALAAAVPPGTPPAKVRLGDARVDGPEAPVHTIVTSPPYPAVYDYLPMQSLRAAWMNLDDTEGLRAEVGARRNFRADRATALRRWQEDLGAWTSRAHHALLPGGRLAVVIGDGLSASRPVDALGTLLHATASAGFTPIARASGDRRDLGSSVARREHILLLERR